MNQNIIKFLAYLPILRVMLAVFYRLIVWVADVGSPYATKYKSIYDQSVSSDNKDLLIKIKKKSKITRCKIAFLSFIVSFTLLYNYNPFKLYISLKN